MTAGFSILGRLLAALLLLCAGAAVGLDLFPASKSSDFVYCPLTRQMQPVHPASVATDPLDDYCLTGERRIEISAALAEPASLAKIATATVDEIVFDHFKRGEAAAIFEGGTPTPIAVVVEGRVSAGSTSSDARPSIVSNVVATTPQSNPRPPTFAAEPGYEPPLLRELTAITRNLRPRSPPFSA